MPKDSPFELSDEDQAAMQAMQAADEPEKAAEPAPEPAPEPEATAEPAEQPEAAPEPDKAEDKRAKTVPHQALHEERERRKAVEAENRRLAEQHARFEERLKVIQELQKPKEDAQPKAPDPQEDPIGALRFLQEQLAAQEQQRQAQTREQQEAQRAEQVWQQVQNHAQAQWQEFAAQNPHANEAYEHVMKSRSRELKAFGYSDAQVREALQREEAQALIYAVQNGISAPEMIMAYAEARGFQPKQADPDPALGAAEKIERATEGQSRNKSLSQTGGAAAPTEMTAERLIAMSNDDFQAWVAKHPKQAERLMGG